MRVKKSRKTMVYILMGVSGAGKTLIGQKLADQLGIPFYDGDNFHPEENVRKMASGSPLNDNDRKPWLETLAKNIKKWEQKGGVVLACSALKKSYRKLLVKEDPDNVQFIYLKGRMSLIAERITGRTDHFMPEELLESQFEALEEPEDAITVSVDQTPDEIINFIISQIGD